MQMKSNDTITMESDVLEGHTLYRQAREEKEDVRMEKVKEMICIKRHAGIA